MTLLKQDREQGARLLLEVYTPLLWSVCRQRLSDPEDIKECVNDVFSTFCMNLDKFDPERSSLKNYLAMLADRKAISCYRSNQRRIQAEANAVPAADPEQEQMRRSLEDALLTLCPEDAEIIRMKYYGGLTYREIARQLGLTEEAVKKRGRRSLSKLAKWMLIGLLIAALLAGCAYVVVRYFRYSRGMGVLPGEELPVYQTADLPGPVSANGIEFYLLNASYSKDDVVLTVAFLPDEDAAPLSRELYIRLIGGYRASVNGSEPAGAAYSQSEMCQFYISVPREELTVDETGYIQLRAELVPNEDVASALQQEYEYEMDLSVLTWDVALEETAAVSDLSELGCYLETAYADFLVLTDWEFSPETGDTYTLISLCPIYKTEGLVLSDLISTCYSLLGDRTQEYITLRDADGEVYPVSCTVCPAPNTASTEFTLWFRNLPAGEYTLDIPSLCYRMEGPVQTVTLALPGQDGESMPCAETAAMPDGSTLSLSGVSRRTREENGVFMTEYWEDGVQSWVPEEDTRPAGNMLWNTM